MSRGSIDVPGLGHGTNPVPAACRIGPLLTTGAVRGVDRTTDRLPQQPEREVDLAFENLVAVLGAGGAAARHVASIDVLLADASLRGRVNEAWLQLFPDPDSRPARHVTVRELPAGMRIQLKAVAFVHDDESVKTREQ